MVGIKQYKVVAVNSYKGIQSRIILKKWRFGRVLPIPDRPTTLKDRATQLLRSRSGALVTKHNIFLL